MKLPKIIVAVGFIAVNTLIGSALSAQPAEVRIVVTPEPGSGMFTDFTLGLDATTPVGSTLRFVMQARSEAIMNAASLGWIFYSPDNSITTGAQIENVGLIGNWASAAMWGLGGPAFNTSLLNGVLPDNVITGGVGDAFGEPNTGGGGFQNSNFIDFIEWTVTFASTGIFCTDSALFPPVSEWLVLGVSGEDLGPLWFGGNGDLSVGGTRTEAYCINVLERNCCATPGDANHDGNVNIADITFLIARIFAGGPQSACCREADANGDARMDITDVVYLIQRIFAGGPAPVCGGPVDNC